MVTLCHEQITYEAVAILLNVASGLHSTIPHTSSDLTETLQANWHYPLMDCCFEQPHSATIVEHFRPSFASLWSS